MTMDISALFLALGVIFGALVAILQLRMTQQYHALAHRQDAQDRMTRMVAAVLTAWAEHWGEPPDEVKPILLAIVHDPRYTQPHVDRPVLPVTTDTWMGGDFGVAALLDRLFERKA